MNTEPIALHASNSHTDTHDAGVLDEGPRMSRVVDNLQLLLAARRAARNAQLVQIFREAA